jgi:hypothetical protein
VSYLAIVEVYTSLGRSDKAPVPITLLDAISVKAIMIRVNSKNEIKKRQIQHL